MKRVGPSLTARVAAWLDDVPIPDRLERRNARTVQIFCIGLTLVLLAGEISSALGHSRALTGFALWYGVFANWASIAACVWSLHAVRRGRAAAASRVLLAVFVGVLVTSFALRGSAIHEHLFARTYAVVLVLAALLLGRKALWTTMVVLLVGLGLGYLHDQVWSTSTAPVAPAEGNLLRAAEVALLLCILIDRFGVALREAYTASRLRESELENALRGLSEESERRARTEALLVQSQRLEALGRLSGGLAHDFNNILTAIHGFTELAQHSIPRDNAAHAGLEQVQAATARATALTRQLMTFARQQIVELRVVDAQEQVRLALPLLARLLGENTVLETVFTAARLHVRIDPMHLGQVLVNLAVNAKDAMPGGGSFRIEVSEAVDETSRWVEFAFTDSGTGMDAETSRRAFDPFFTTKERGQGTGLGLATCHGIVCQAGGSISVESSPGRGTTFRVRLPRTEQPLDPLVAPKRPVRAGRIRGETILVVEDDAQIRELVENLLTTAGYRVCTAEGPGAALESSASPAPSLLLTDVIMPGGDGKNLAETLRARNPEMAVLYMSGHTADVVGRQSASEAEGAVLQKPFTPEELLSRVDELLAGRESVVARRDRLLSS